jgi:hypothetical protein
MKTAVPPPESAQATDNQHLEISLLVPADFLGTGKRVGLVLGTTPEILPASAVINGCIQRMGPAKLGNNPRKRRQNSKTDPT